MHAVETPLDVTTTLPFLGAAPAAPPAYPSGASVSGGDRRSSAPATVEEVSAL